MRILLIILFSFISINAHATDYYFRDDGGIPNTECSGLYDKPKSTDKNCAYSYNYIEVMATKDSSDNFIISKGNMAIDIGPTSLWITMDQFKANTEFYIREAINGRKVYFKSIDGVARQLQLPKY